jgi:endonuclease V-like protein UPF0215 family
MIGLIIYSIGVIIILGIILYASYNVVDGKEVKRFIDKF